MNIDDIEQALKEARQTLAVGDKVLPGAVRLVAGRLRLAHSAEPENWKGVGPALAKLKAELRRFNAKTQTWKD